MRPPSVRACSEFGGTDYALATDNVVWRAYRVRFVNESCCDARGPQLVADFISIRSIRSQCVCLFVEYGYSDRTYASCLYFSVYHIRSNKKAIHFSVAGILCVCVCGF